MTFFTDIIRENQAPGLLLPNWKRGVLPFFCLLLMLVIPPLNAETLTAGVEPWIPWIIKEKGKYTGIVIEISKEAFLRAGHRCVVMEIPTKRREMIEWGRSVNVEPGCEPLWRVKQKKVSVYTKAYIRTRNVIVTRKGYYPNARSIAAFYGTTIGANTGYYYTDGLSQAFDKGLILRDDCGAGHLLISKLLKNRFHAIVADTHEWKYWMKTLGHDLSGFEETYAFSHTNNLTIRLHKNKAYLIPALNEALEEMAADGSITAIVNRFLTD